MTLWTYNHINNNANMIMLIWSFFIFSCISSLVFFLFLHSFVLLLYANTCMHIHTHKYTHARTRARAHARTHTHTHTQKTHAQSRAYSNTYSAYLIVYCYYSRFIFTYAGMCFSITKKSNKQIVKATWFRQSMKYSLQR